MRLAQRWCRTTRVLRGFIERTCIGNIHKERLNLQRSIALAPVFI